MDKILKKYMEELRETYGQDNIPEFSEDAVHTAPILAVLQDPDNPGARKETRCSFLNPDPTAERQKEILDSVGIETAEVVPWNFFASYDANKRFVVKSQKEWANELQKLIALMPNLKVMVICGTKAWIGMRFVELRRPIILIPTPHPADRGVSQPDAEERLKRAWERAESIIH
jgi:hypothetical protein